MARSALRELPASAPPNRFRAELVDCPVCDTADCPEILSFCGALRSVTGPQRLGASLMLSSAVRGEGKTTVGVAAAVALRKTFGMSVLYIDASDDGDVIMRWPPGSHLTWAHVEDYARSTVDRRNEPELKILSLPADRLDMMFGGDSGAQMASIEARIRQRFDIILIDAPSVIELPLVTSVGRFVDGVVLVVEAERTRWPVVQHAKEEFERRESTVLGVFLNRRRRYIPTAVYKLL